MSRKTDIYCPKTDTHPESCSVWISVLCICGVESAIEL